MEDFKQDPRFCPFDKRDPGFYVLFEHEGEC